MAAATLMKGDRHFAAGNSLGQLGSHGRPLSIAASGGVHRLRCASPAYALLASRRMGNPGRHPSQRKKFWYARWLAALSPWSA